MTQVYTLYILVLGDNMQIKLQKWGNSLGIRIPASVISELKLRENDLLNLKLEYDKIIIKKDNHKTIAEIFEGYTGDYVCEEFEPFYESYKELW